MTPFEELTKSDVDTTIDVNLKGTIYAVKLSVPYFEKTGGGNILNISSMSAIRGIPDPVNNNGIYTATKFAINGFTECMQKYLLWHPRNGALPRLHGYKLVDALDTFVRHRRNAPGRYTGRHCRADRHVAGEGFVQAASGPADR